MLPPGLPPFLKNSPDRVRLAGPAVPLSPRLAVVLSMIVHEIATNAAKYGALSSDQGHLVISCRHFDSVQITWSERGGPAKSVSDHTGFGSTLIKRTVGNLNGRITSKWRNDGVDIVIDLPFGTLLV